MSLSTISKRAGKVVSDNSPALLTAVAVSGTLTTAYLTGKASFKAADLLREANMMAIPNGETVTSFDGLLTTKEQIEVVWKLYIPATVSAAGTIGCIILVNRIGTRRAAAMAVAYSISEAAFSEYKEKVVETMGRQKEEKIRAEIQQDRINTDPPNEHFIVDAHGGQELCKDAWSARYFFSDMETIKQAQNDTNYEVLNHGYASLTDFYNRLGLEPTKESDNVGWNSDKLLEVMVTGALSDANKPILVLDFTVAPVRNFFRSR